jgi:hypothetical protein
LNENNILSDFYYVFSTGNYVDSLIIDGFIYNAFDLKPQEKCLVMLYLCSNDTIPCDSLPYLCLPNYISQTHKDGSFRLNNLRNNAYKMVALKDQNRNYLFDKGEEIAFYNELVTPKTPTVKHDTIIRKADSLSIPIEKNIMDTTDSLNVQKKDEVVRLMMFQEQDSVIRVLKTIVSDSMHAVVIFTGSVKDVTCYCLPTNYDDKPDSNPDLLSVWSKNMDSITLWFRNYLKDTVYLCISQYGNCIDTLELTVDSQSAQKKTGKHKETEDDVVQPVVMQISSNASGRFPFFSKLALEFSAPLDSFRSEDILFYIGNDSISQPAPPIILNELSPQKAQFDCRFKEKTSYRMVFPSGTFTDIFGHQNDSVAISFNTDEPDIYGNLKLEIIIPQQYPQLLLQLLNDKEQVLQQHVLTESHIVDFGYLQPGKLRLKIIYDLNKNEQWDAGNYLKGIQPEKVIFFDKTIEIRPNWDIEESWDLEKDNER